MSEAEVTVGDWEVCDMDGLMVPAANYDVPIVRMEGQRAIVVASVTANTKEEAYRVAYLMAAAKKMKDATKEVIAILRTFGQQSMMCQQTQIVNMGTILETALAATIPPSSN